MKTIERYYRVDRAMISFIKFIFEACDGIATLTTINAPMGIVRFGIAPGCQGDFDQVLSSLQKDMRIEAWQENQPGAGCTG